MNGTGLLIETVDLESGIGRQMLATRNRPATDPGSEVSLTLTAVVISGSVVQVADYRKADAGMLGMVRQLALAGF